MFKKMDVTFKCNEKIRQRGSGTGNSLEPLKVMCKSLKRGLRPQRSIFFFLFILGVASDLKIHDIDKGYVLLKL